MPTISELFPMKTDRNWGMETAKPVDVSKLVNDLVRKVHDALLEALEGARSLSEGRLAEISGEMEAIVKKGIDSRGGKIDAAKFIQEKQKYLASLIVGKMRVGGDRRELVERVRWGS